MLENYEDWTISSEASNNTRTFNDYRKASINLDELSRVGEIRNGRLSYYMIEDIV